MAKSSLVDLSKFTIPELQEIARDIETEVVTRREREREKVVAQMRDLAASIGMTPEELLGSGDRARGAKATPKYRHPENPALTWGGRGKRPAWVNEWVNGGRSLDDLAAE